MRAAVAGVVRKQVGAGITVVNDGEQGKPGYSTYIKDRVTGFGGESRVTDRVGEGRDFPEYVGAPHGRTRGQASGARPATARSPGRDFAAVERDIANLKAAVEAPGRRRCS